MGDNRALWMRYVDFEEIKNMFHIIHENNGKLRAGELEQLCIEKGVLLNKSIEKPLSRSTRYRYRKALENLGLAQNKNGKYYISWDSLAFDLLMSTKFKEDMNDDAKNIFKEIIIKNRDCRTYFFNIFMNKNSYSLDEFQKNGSHIFVETKSMRELPNDKIIAEQRTSNKFRSIVLKNPNGKKYILNTYDQIFAIYTGIRLWSLKLEITNEIITNFNEGRIIYPVNPNYDENIILDLLLSRINICKSEPEWITIHIPTFLRDSILITHFQIKKIKDFILNLKMRYPNNIMFIPTSTAFIDIKTPYNKQDPAFRNSYLYDRRKGYISHLRINQCIRGEVKNGRILLERGV